MPYKKFLNEKKVKKLDAGFTTTYPIHPMLFDFQKDIVLWALKKGRAAIFASCGLGKTIMQLSWADHVCKHTKSNVLILSPLAVTVQTKGEGEKIGVNVNICRKQDDVVDGVNITNYELFHKFDMSKFSGIVLDESSILKNFEGKYKNMLIEECSGIQYKLACTATPAPNDYMELGNHAEFLNVMKRSEMLAMFFVHDGGDTSKWRLKKHAESLFWEWMCSWAVMIDKPSDLGYSDDMYILPNLNIIEVIVPSKPTCGRLFADIAETLQERQKARRLSIGDRIAKAADIIGKSDESWIVWCNLNDESDGVAKAINGVEIAGRHDLQYKVDSMIAFSNNEIKRLITKPHIAGFGLNWQHCHNVIFLGLSDSYESFYQATRRCWRFGQKNEVNVYIVLSESEGSIIQNIKRKEDDFKKMIKGMVNHMKGLNTCDVHEHIDAESVSVATDMVCGDKWTMYFGDCVDVTSKMDDDSIDFSIFSPPFSSLYTYSDMAEDMGNNINDDAFFQHFGYLINNLHRIIKNGRLCAIHCMNLPLMKGRDGEIGLKDFRGDIIRAFQKAGFIYHTEVVIWKSPVVEVTRTKALGLLHKQIQKDSAMCRVGMPDYLVVMRKKGENADRITHTKEDFPVSQWQQWASPIWMDINQTNTLQRESARQEKDEKHICPLQLDVIERALTLWSNKGDTILSPFAGIGSEGYMSIKLHRKFIGIELKQSYFEQAVKNMQNISTKASMQDMFAFFAQEVL